MASTYLPIALGLALAIGACAAPSDNAASSNEDITGVTDLTELESALQLSHDFKTAAGTWYRTDDRLAGGPCYREFAASGAYELRRYSSGAAFFPKAGGDLRQVVCVDLDVYKDDGSFAATVKLDDFEVDGAIRYRWGAYRGGDSGMGSHYEEFQGGNLHFLNPYCGPNKLDALAPNALTSGCLAGASWPGSITEIDGPVLLLVYQYAYGHSLEGYSSKTDPIGRFIDVEGDWQSPVQHVRYERMDAHIVRGSDGRRAYYLTPKNSDDALAERAVATFTPATTTGLP